LLSAQQTLGKELDMEHSLHFISVLSSFLFTGAAIYINLVEHPARMACGTEIAVSVFGPSYRRAAPVQVTLAMVATVGGVWSWLLGGHVLWLVGAVLIFSVIPFTLLVIMPINKQLLASELDAKSPTTRALLARWARLHCVRSVASLIASCIFLALAIRA
jgi:uncharacterized membrane protein